MGTINSSDRIAAKFYCLGKWFLSGIYVNTMHRGDKEIVCFTITITIITIIIIIIIIIINCKWVDTRWQW
jgi:uncharacterized Tic20 family protein